jgi:hypothetical protein
MVTATCSADDARMTAKADLFLHVPGASLGAPTSIAAALGGRRN